jgi:hypothetical protein
MEVELDFTNGPVTALGDNKVSDVGNFRVVWLIVAWTINETHNVGILLD